MTEIEIKSMLFRASSMGAIMTGVAKGWDVDKSLTCQRKLVQMFREHEWKRRSQKSNKYTEKGTQQEDESITTYCRVKKTMFTKNDIRLSDDHFTGELDLFEGTEINKAKRVIDIKSSWDWTTFPSLCDVLDSDYDYQGQTYMKLTGAAMHTVAHCLVNTPASIIVDEKRRLSWKMGVIDSQSDDYLKACTEIEKNCIVDMKLFIKDNTGFEFDFTSQHDDWVFDIPIEQRVHEIDVVRDDKKIARMIERVEECRLWMINNLI